MTGWLERLRGRSRSAGLSGSSRERGGPGGAAQSGGSRERGGSWERGGPGGAAQSGGSRERGGSWRARLQGQGWRLAVLLLLIAYFVWLDQHVKLRPDHAFLIFFLVVLVLRQARTFLRDWSPFIGAWIVYDMMRGIADDLRPRVEVEWLYNLEVKLFGWLTHGEAPPIYSLTFQREHAGSWIIGLLDNVSTACYAMHMGAPIILAWVLWHTARDRRLFYKFALCFTLINIIGFSVFIAMPTAPPWYVAEYGFAQPPAEFKGHGAGSLVNFDEKIGFPLFENVYRRMNPNRFAAFPSLHAAYALFVCIFAMKRFRWKALPVVLFPVGMSVGAVYLVHHYIIDVLAGYVVVGIAMGLGLGVIYPRLFGKWEARWLAAGGNGVPREAADGPPHAGAGEGRRFAGPEAGRESASRKEVSA